LTQEKVDQATTEVASLASDPLLDVPPESPWLPLKCAVEKLAETLEKVTGDLQQAAARANARHGGAEASAKEFFGPVAASRSSIAYRASTTNVALNYVAIDSAVVACPFYVYTPTFLSHPFLRIRIQNTTRRVWDGALLVVFQSELLLPLWWIWNHRFPFVGTYFLHIAC
jgi:hypothetical protein